MSPLAMLVKKSVGLQIMYYVGMYDLADKYPIEKAISRKLNRLLDVKKIDTSIEGGDVFVCINNVVFRGELTERRKRFVREFNKYRKGRPFQSTIMLHRVT